jgi:hypothetical protein
MQSSAGRMFDLHDKYFTLQQYCPNIKSAIFNGKINIYNNLQIDNYETSNKIQTDFQLDISFTADVFLMQPKAKLAPVQRTGRKYGGCICKPS